MCPNQINIALGLAMQAKQYHANPPSAQEAPGCHGSFWAWGFSGLLRRFRPW